MADLNINFAGIRSPNPFWLASAPPADSGAQIHRAFEAGWGGAVWKTLGKPIQKVSSRLSALNHGSRKMIGLNNIELITDRPIETNLKEMEEVKNKFPKIDRSVYFCFVKSCHDPLYPIQSIHPTEIRGLFNPVHI